MQVWCVCAIHGKVNALPIIQHAVPTALKRATVAVPLTQGLPLANDIGWVVALARTTLSSLLCQKSARGVTQERVHLIVTVCWCCWLFCIICV